jgi:hypothetical protein
VGKEAEALNERLGLEALMVEQIRCVVYGVNTRVVQLGEFGVVSVGKGHIVSGSICGFTMCSCKGHAFKRTLQDRNSSSRHGINAPHSYQGQCGWYKVPCVQRTLGWPWIFLERWGKQGSFFLVQVTRW